MGEGAGVLPAGLRAILIFSAVSLLQGASWAPFASTPTEAAGLGFHNATLEWQENANNITQLFATVAAAWVLAPIRTKPVNR